MAKNNNLTDFLKGLADKFRSVLGTSALIDPQDFEDQIQQVYNHGFSEGGPTGITAKAADVLYGKVFGSGGNGKSTGTMPNIGSVSRPTKYQATDGAHLYAWTPYGYHSNYDSNGHLIEQSFGSVASAIGLTAAKIVKGNTILGIAGSGGTPYARWSGTSTYPGSVPVVNTNMTKSGSTGVVIPSAGTYLLGWFEVRDPSINGNGLRFTRNGAGFGSSEKFEAHVGGIPFFTASLSAGDVIKVTANDRWADTLGGVIVKLV